MRPKSDIKRKQVALRLGEQFIEQMDAVRGAESREAWMRRVLRAEVARLLSRC